MILECYRHETKNDPPSPTLHSQKPPQQQQQRKKTLAFNTDMLSLSLSLESFLSILPADYKSVSRNGRHPYADNIPAGIMPTATLGGTSLVSGSLKSTPSSSCLRSVNPCRTSMYMPSPPTAITLESDAPHPPKNENSFSHILSQNSNLLLSLTSATTFFLMFSFFTFALFIVLSVCTNLVITLILIHMFQNLCLQRTTLYELISLHVWERIILCSYLYTNLCFLYVATNKMVSRQCCLLVCVCFVTWLNLGTFRICMAYPFIKVLLLFFSGKHLRTL